MLNNKYISNKQIYAIIKLIIMWISLFLSIATILFMIGAVAIIVDRFWKLI